MKSHTVQQNLLSTEMRAKINYDRNVRPLIIQQDMDFSSNGVIENHEKLQSEHWVTVPYTLFVSVTNCFLAIEWNRVSGELLVGNELNVHGEMIGEYVNTDSFWGDTMRVIGGDKYEVKNYNGEL